MKDQMEHGNDILRVTHAVICGRSIEEAERAFATLCTVDLEAAIPLADLMVLASPGSASLWQAIIDTRAKEQPQAPSDIDRQAGPALSDNDDSDTARALAAHMGWRDVEAGGRA